MKATRTRMVWWEKDMASTGRCFMGCSYRWKDRMGWFDSVRRLMLIELGSPLSAPLGALVRLDVPIKGRFVEVAG